MFHSWPFLTIFVLSFVSFPVVVLTSNLKCHSAGDESPTVMTAVISVSWHLPRVEGQAQSRESKHGVIGSLSLWRSHFSLMRMVKVQRSNNQKRSFCTTKMMFVLPTVATLAWFSLRGWMPFLPMQKSTNPSTILQAVEPPECEGYWPDTEICLELGTSPSQSLLTQTNAGCPQWHINPAWEINDKQALSTKLHEIEGIAKEWEGLLQEITGEQLKQCGGEQGVKPLVWISRQRGVAWSRMEENVMAGNCEYRTDSGACWTDALLPIYIDKFGVEPSEKFKTFVATFNVESFRDALQHLKDCMGQ